MKQNADLRNRAEASDLKPGDVVLVKQPKRNKLSMPFKHTPFQIQSKTGTMVTASDDYCSVTRNSSFFKRIPSRFVRNERVDVDDLSDVEVDQGPVEGVVTNNSDVDDEVVTQNREQVAENNTPVQLRRSQRTTQNKQDTGQCTCTL